MKVVWVLTIFLVTVLNSFGAKVPIKLQQNQSIENNKNEQSMEDIIQKIRTERSVSQLSSNKVLDDDQLSGESDDESLEVAETQIFSPKLRTRSKKLPAISSSKIWKRLTKY